jgi:hypothetical protein
MEVLALVGVPYFLFKIVNIPFSELGYPSSDLGYPSVDLGGAQVFPINCLMVKTPIKAKHLSPLSPLHKRGGGT